MQPSNKGDQTSQVPPLSYRSAPGSPIVQTSTSVSDAPQHVSGSTPANPPRALTRPVCRVIWSEPRVRRWWLLAGIILVLFTAYTVQRVWARNEESALIRNGLKVSAKLVFAETRNNNQLAEPGDNVELELNLPTGVEKVAGTITAPAVVTKNITVRLDPKDHSRWTDRTEPPPLLDSLLVGILVFPLVPALFVFAFLNMRRMRSVWQTGPASIAVIYERKQSAIAPMSYVVRCSLQNHRDKQLFDVYVPRVGYGLGKGDLIWVIMPVKKGQPVAALWMGEEAGSVSV
jgi:hypothetical protein